MRLKKKKKGKRERGNVDHFFDVEKRKANVRSIDVKNQVEENSTFLAVPVDVPRLDSHLTDLSRSSSVPAA